MIIYLQYNTAPKKMQANREKIRHIAVDFPQTHDILLLRRGLRGEVMPIQYLSAIGQMSSEALILAAAVAAVTALLKKTLLKNAHRFVRSALPFFLGIVFFTVYRMAVTMSFDPVTKELVATLSSGFACGSAATLFSALFEHYFPQSESTPFSPVYPLLEGYVPESRRAEAAKELYEGSLTIDGELLSAYLDETLKKYISDSVSDEERTDLRLLIEQFLYSLRKKSS